MKKTPVPEAVLNEIAAALRSQSSSIETGGGCDTCGYGGSEETVLKEDDFGAAVTAIAEALSAKGMLAGASR